MKFIVPEIVKIIKDSDTAMIREMRLLQLFIRIFTQALGIALETIDTELTAEYTKQGYQMKRRDFRTIQGLLLCIDELWRARHTSDGVSAEYVRSGPCGSGEQQ
jgi:citrate lyase synthetase